eukprot:4593530-Pyramimonas_sp.AAC.1
MQRCYTESSCASRSASRKARAPRAANNQAVAGAVSDPGDGAPGVGPSRAQPLSGISRRWRRSSWTER